MRFMNNWAVGLGVALLALGACKKSDENKANAEPTALASGESQTATATGKAPAAQASAEDADDELGEKLSKYIQCTNSTTNSVTSSQDRYLSWVNPAKGPDLKTRNIYGLYSIRASECERLIPEGDKHAPALPELHTLAKNYLDSLRALDTLVKPAERYYSQEDYKDDKMQKGKEMHGPLMEGFKAFENAAKAFSEKVTSLNDQVSERRLGRLEKDPQHRLAYLVEKQMWESKKLVKLAKVESLAALDANTYQPELETVSKLIDEVRAYAEAHKEEASKASLSSFVSSSEAFLKSTKELGRRKRENKDFNKEFFSKSNPELVDGHPAQVIKNYNSLIDNSNRVRL